LSNRGYTDRELRLVTEWAATAYPEARVIQRYRVGTPPPYVPPGWTSEQVQALMKPTGFMVDAVVELPTTTLVVEAKTDNESAAVGQLLFYVWLMKKYPQYQEVDVTHLLPVLLFARQYPDLLDFAASLGVATSMYSPDWIQEFLRVGYTG